MTQNMDKQPQIKRETKNKIRVEFERTDLKERLKAKYLSMFFLKRTVWFLFRFLLLVGIAFVVLQPFYTMIMRSITAPADFVDSTVVNVPRHFSMGIYKAIIVDLEYFKVFFKTLALSLSTALLQTFSCCLIGYGLAKFKFRGVKAVFFAVILTLIIPHGTLQSAIYYRFRYFDILNLVKLISGGKIIEIGSFSITSPIKILSPDKFSTGINTLETVVPLLILSVTGLAFKNGLYIFMLRQFFRGVPDELEESAYLDGANTFRTFVQVILPLSIPMMITVFLFAFCWQWTDDFYLPLFYTVKTPQFMTNLASTLPPPSLQATYTKVTGSSGGYLRAMRYACGLMVCTPLIILYLFCQRYLVQGIERSGIVG